MHDNITHKLFYNKLKLSLFKVIHFLISGILFVQAWRQFTSGVLLPGVDVGLYSLPITVTEYCIILFYFLKTYNAYLLGYRRVRDLVFSQTLSQLFSILFLYIFFSLAWNIFGSPYALIVLVVEQLLLNVLWSFLGNYFYYKLNHTRRSLLIYRNKLDRKRFNCIAGKPFDRLYKITEELQFNGLYEELESNLHGYEAIFVAGVNSRCRNGILKYCLKHNVRGFFLPHVGDLIMKGAEHIQSFDSPVLFVSRNVRSPEYLIAKRVLDICLSLIGIIFWSPFMLITAAAIKLYDGGPVIYKQVRLTKDNKKFEIYKFRSMRVDAEIDGIARLSTGDNDVRITPIGKIIRKIRFDELPQMFNIIKGDMSIVGPRPERPEIAEKYYESIPEFALRLQVKAGLTGYAQIYGKYNTDPYEKLEFDLLYINDMNLITDLGLIFSTFAILFSSKSTEGIKDGQMTAIDNEAQN